jgi:hypothetical protein
MILCVNYDLRAPGRNYQPLYDALTRYTYCHMAVSRRGRGEAIRRKCAGRAALLDLEPAAEAPVVFCSASCVTPARRPHVVIAWPRAYCRLNVIR